MKHPSVGATLAVWLLLYAVALCGSARAEWVDATHGALGDTGPGVGVAFGDIDNDGDLDLYLRNEDGSDKLFRNEGGGTFVDVTAPPLGTAGPGAGAAFADIDNDGDLDLYVASSDGAQAKLFRNEGGGVWFDHSNRIYPPGSPTGERVIFGDILGLGVIDFYLVAGGDCCPNQLFWGDSYAQYHFRDGAPGGTGRDRGLAFADVDNDGDLDLYLASDGLANQLWRNDSNPSLSFADVSVGPMADEGAGRAVAFGDIDNDGDLDLYLANAGSANKLLRNEGGGAFVDATAGPLGDAGPGGAVAFGDIDNDGDLDLYLVNSGSANKLLRNEGGGVFVDATTGPLGDVGFGAGVAFGDVDNDGDLDLYLVNRDGANKLLRNDGEAAGNHWLQVHLVGGEHYNFSRLVPLSNKSGIGARVRVVAGGRSQIREVSGGTGQSQNDLTAEFGLGPVTAVDSLIVYWPSGDGQFVGAIGEIDRRLTVVEVAQALPGLGDRWPNGTSGWYGGGSGGSNQLESNPGSGGVGGAGDGFLLFSTVGAHEDYLHNYLRLGVRSSSARYLGDWRAWDIRKVTFWLNDIGQDDDLEMHFAIGFRRSSSEWNYWQYNEGFRPPEHSWKEFTVDLTDESRFTQIWGSGTFDEALRNVSWIHIRHDRAPFVDEPDTIRADVGLDHLMLHGPEPPECSINGPGMACIGDHVQLCGPEGEHQYQWTGPGGAMASGACIQPRVTGTYTLVVTDPTTGLSSEPCEHYLELRDCLAACPQPRSFWKKQCKEHGERDGWEENDGTGAAVVAEEVGMALEPGGGVSGGLGLGRLAKGRLEPGDLARIAAAVDAQVRVFEWGEASALERFCELVVGKPSKAEKHEVKGKHAKKDKLAKKRLEAEREFAVLLANHSAGELGIVPGDGLPIALGNRVAVRCKHGEWTMVSELIAETDALLVKLAGEGVGEKAGKKRYEEIKKCLEEVNKGKGLALTCGKKKKGREALASEASEAGGGSLVGREALQPYRPSPNPFEGRMRLAYEVGGRGAERVEIGVYDLAGGRVATLARGWQAAGRYEVSWDGRSGGGEPVANGVYFIRSEVGEERRVMRVVRLAR